MTPTPPAWLERYALDLLARLSPAGRGRLLSTKARVAGVNVYAKADILGPGLPGILAQGTTKFYVSRVHDERPITDALNEIGERNVDYRTGEEIRAADQKSKYDDIRGEAEDWLRTEMGGRIFVACR